MEDLPEVCPFCGGAKWEMDGAPAWGKMKSCRSCGAWFRYRPNEVLIFAAGRAEARQWGDKLRDWGGIAIWRNQNPATGNWEERFTAIRNSKTGKPVNNPFGIGAGDYPDDIVLYPSQIFVKMSLAEWLEKERET